MRIDLIVNSRARRYERDPSLVRRLRDAARSRAVFHATGSLDELSAACAEAASAGSSLVILTGGDGSLMAGTTAIARAFGDRLPKLGFLPAGTAAIISKNWGIRGEPVALLERLLRAAANGAPLRADPHPTLRVIGETAARAEERIGFIFGTGLVAKFFHLYYEDGARGNAGAARLVARIFAESFVGGAFARRVLDPLQCTIEVDGRALRPEAFSLVCSAVIRDLGLGMRVTYRAGEDPRRPHLVCNPLPSRSLGWRMPFVLAGRPIGGADSFDDLAREFVVRFPSLPDPHDPTAADAGGPYVLDGDILRARAVRVSAGPELLVVKP